jgi:hypothetical protein
MLQDLLVYALSVAALCCGKALVHKAVVTLFRRLCPGGRRRRWRLRAGPFVVRVTLTRRTGP